jgi:hypothetical protein
VGFVPGGFGESSIDIDIIDRTQNPETLLESRVSRTSACSPGERLADYYYSIYTLPILPGESGRKKGKDEGRFKMDIIVSLYIRNIVLLQKARLYVLI